jgi:hypothetical protein
MQWTIVFMQSIQLRKSTLYKLKASKPFHVMFTLNQLYLWPGTIALRIFPLLTIVSGNHNLAYYRSEANTFDSKQIIFKAK